MVDKLISAYRGQIYDWTFASFFNTIKRNKKLFATALLSMLIVTALFIWGIASKHILLALIAISLEAVGCIWIDRYAVRQHRKFLISRKEHLDSVAEFLRTVIPNVDLYNPRQISELIVRLSTLIASNYPFAQIGRRLKTFASTIIIPILTYIAGVCSSYLQKLEPPTVLLYSVVAIIFIGFAWFIVSGFLNFIRPIFCRDFDAAVSLREDLLDLQLLYFPSKKD